MRHLLWFDVAFYLVAGVYLAAHPQHSLRYAGGMGVAALAMVLWILARIQLGRAFSVSARATTLVTSGLYSKIRNPIYFFGHIAILGLLVAWGYRIWLWLTLALLGIPFQMARARKEGAVLEAAFGDEYRRYKAKTWF